MIRLPYNKTVTLFVADMVNKTSSASKRSTGRKKKKEWFFPFLISLGGSRKHRGDIARKWVLTSNGKNKRPSTHHPIIGRKLLFLGFFGGASCIFHSS